MKYKKINMGPYNLHMVKTDKYKKIVLKICFKRKVKKDEITIRTLLTTVLAKSSMNYKTTRLMELKTQDLYCLTLDSSSYISGNYNIFSFATSFLTDKYTQEGQVKDCIDFTLDVLFNPNVENGQFDKEVFNEAYEALKESLETQNENPSFYSSLRADEETDKTSSISFNAAGYLEDLEKIDEKKLYNYYLSILKSDLVDVFIIGDIDQNEFKDLFNKKFKIKTIKTKGESHFLEHKKIRKKVKTVIEKKPYEQSKLIITFKTKDLTTFERNYVMRIYSYILGGGPNSKLFKEVREKNSLCYSINSEFFPVSNLFKIRAGINKEAFKKCVSLVKKELKKMEKGIFTNEDIEAGKQTYISSFESINDNPTSALGTYISHEYFDYDYIEDRIKNINKITKEMIISVSKKIHMDTVYMLEGDLNGKN